MGKFENTYENVDNKYMRSVGSQDQPLVLQGSTIYTKVGPHLKPIMGSGSEEVTIKWEDISDKPTSMPASDVYDWAKQPDKPIYNKTDIGLSNVDNTSDANKPISTATQNALDLKANINGDPTEDFSVANLNASKNVIASGDVISKKEGSVIFAANDAVGGSQYLYQMLDVEIPTPANGDMLVYKAEIQKWINVNEIIFDSGTYSII